VDITFVVGTGHGGLISLFSTGTELIAVPFMKFIGPKILVDLNEDCQNQSGCSRLNCTSIVRLGTWWTM